MPHDPRRTAILLVVLAVLAMLPTSVAEAQRRNQPGEAASPAAAAQTAAEPAQPPRPALPLLPADAVTAHTLTLNGHEIAYAARAGALPLTDDKGEKTAEIFFVAYTLADADPTTRPITFAFNGGPGAASAYLHMGALGPRVLDFGDGLSPPGAASRIVDNPDTWLPFTDLVFIDPVGTGYSRASGEVKDVGKTFWGVGQDLDALTATVRLALARLDRVASPIYLAGESYGGFRAARLVARLANGQGIAVRGAVLVSPVLEFSLSGSDDFNPMPWALRLPSEAAVNLAAQGKLTEDALGAAEKFALGDYLATLVAPAADARRQAGLYPTIAGFIGLPEGLVARWNGRVPTGVFVKEFRHAQGEIVSSYDGAVAGDDPYPSAAVARGDDPVFAGIIAPLTTAFVAYARNELQFKTDRRYALLEGEVSQKWDWGRRGPSGAAGASDDLRRGLALSPGLRLLIAHGMTDLVTPYLASRFVVDHLPPTLVGDRVALKLYAGGHMMYLRPASRAALRSDAEAMYRATGR